MRLKIFLSMLSLLVLSSCDSTELTLKENEEGLSIYIPKESTIIDYFQNNRLLVTTFEKDDIDDPDTKVREIQTNYQSINIDRNSVVYPHIIRVIMPEGVQINIDEIDTSTTMLVLKSQEEDGLYYLIGTWTVPLNERPLSFFKDKPEYLLRDKN